MVLWAHWWLMLSFSSISHPQVLLRACSHPSSAQSVFVFGIAPVQVQSLTPGLVELQQNKHCQYSMNILALVLHTHVCKHLMSVKMPLLATCVRFGLIPTCWAHMLWICRQRAQPCMCSFSESFFKWKAFFDFWWAHTTTQFLWPSMIWKIPSPAPSLLLSMQRRHEQMDYMGAMATLLPQWVIRWPRLWGCGFITGHWNAQPSIHSALCLWELSGK